MVNAWSKEKTILSLKPLRICLTVSPRFTVTRAEVLGAIYLCYTTKSFDPLHVLSKKTLTSTSHDELLFLRLLKCRVKSNFGTKMLLPL